MNSTNLLGSAIGMGIGGMVSRFAVYPLWQGRQVDPATAQNTTYRTYFTLGGAVLGAVAGTLVSSRLQKDARETAPANRLRDDDPKWFTGEVWLTPYDSKNRDADYRSVTFNVKAHSWEEAEDVALTYYGDVWGETHMVDIDDLNDGKDENADDTLDYSYLGDKTKRSRRSGSKRTTKRTSRSRNKTIRVKGKNYDVTVRGNLGDYTPNLADGKKQRKFTGSFEPKLVDVDKRRKTSWGYYTVDRRAKDSGSWTLESIYARDVHMVEAIIDAILKPAWEKWYTFSNIEPEEITMPRQNDYPPKDRPMLYYDGKWRYVNMNILKGVR